MPKFSIIIPIYNAEMTLNRCLDSIMGQTFSDFEVIMIDDGSMDSSNEICKKYCEQDKRFYLFSQMNSGPSKSRNVGIDNAKGSWICFVDSDDYVSEDYLEKINDAIISEDVDSVFMGYHQVDNNGVIIKSKVPSFHSPEIKEIAIELSKIDMFGYTWIKVFKRNVIGDIRFSEELNLFEDEMFACNVINKCKKISIIHESLYYYVNGVQDALTNRTYQDYCVKSDLVYKAWKSLLSEEKYNNYLAQKANSYVERCKYYCFERDVDLNHFVDDLSNTLFFKEHTSISKFDKCVQKKQYLMIGLEKVKYLSIIKLSKMIRK
ncbi:MAG: glycosyltransferase family 2 protein [Erysipelotrichaceae bacterium]|nr:glycosyltransferase family 2 protein [Erysipelotrichaceae bacterium]